SVVGILTFSAAATATTAASTSSTASPTATTTTSSAAFTTLSTLGAQGLAAWNNLSLSQALTAGKDIALINPDLDPDVAIRRRGFCKAVVDVRPQRVQRDLAVALMLTASHFGASQPACAHDADASHAELHRTHDRLPHRALVSDALLNLLRHGFGHE